MTWQPIETAPRNGDTIQAEIPGHGTDNLIAWMPGFVGNNDEDVSAWVFMSDAEPPDSWTDGVCWAVNEDGEPSVLPTRWKPAPEVK